MHPVFAVLIPPSAPEAQARGGREGAGLRSLDPWPVVVLPPPHPWGAYVVEDLHFAQLDPLAEKNVFRGGAWTGGHEG